MTNWTTSFSLSPEHGDIDLSERGPETSDDGYEVLPLIDIKTRGISLSLSRDEDEETGDKTPSIQLSMNAYHQENKETKRAFHATLAVNMTLGDAQAMRDFLECIIKVEGLR